jgi:dCTP deaminase
MSILSDKQIKARCIAPTHRITRVSKVGSAWVERAPEDVVLTEDELDILLGRTQIKPPVRRFTPEERADFAPMIEPFVATQVREKEHRINADQGHVEKVVSYGLSSYGYDVRCADEFKIFTNVNSALVDPKNFDEKAFMNVKADEIIIPPNSFALARTVEYFRIPRDVLVVCLGKSTYARCGIIVNVTPLEPEWEGHVTLEFSNTTPLPAKIYANEGCAQFLFLKADDVCDQSYKDKGGKYQGQTGVVTPRM